MTSGIGDISGNPALQSLYGLDSVYEMMGELAIEHNESLDSLAGLAALHTLGGKKLYIRHNPGLPRCEVEALRQGLLDNGWSGYAYLNGNDEDAVCE